MSQFGNLQVFNAFIGTMLTLGVAFQASAQAPDGGAAEVVESRRTGAHDPAVSRGYPVEASQRSLVLPAGWVRVDLDQTVLGFSPSGNVASPYWSLGFGAAVGLGYGLELGVSSHRTGAPLPQHDIYEAGAPGVMLSPRGSYGNVPIYLRQHLLRTDAVDAAIDLGMDVPVGSDFAMDFGLQIRVYAHRLLTLDLGAKYLLALQSPDAQGCPSGATCADGSTLSLWLPLSATVQLGPRWIVAIDSGIELSQTDVTRSAIPVGVRMAYTLPMRHELVDFGVSASWPRLVRPFAADPTTADLWRLQLTAQGYLGL